jgi:hypothetical protein
MKITIGKEGLEKTWQAKFPETTKCCRGMDEDVIYPRNFVQFLCDIHKNKGKGSYWLRDCCAVAVYFCRECLETTSLYNQG